MWINLYHNTIFVRLCSPRTLHICFSSSSVLLPVIFFYSAVTHIHSCMYWLIYDMNIPISSCYQNLFSGNIEFISMVAHLKVRYDGGVCFNVVLSTKMSFWRLQDDTLQLKRKKRNILGVWLTVCFLIFASHLWCNWSKKLFYVLM